MRIILNGEPKDIVAGTIPSLLAAENIPQDHWSSLAVARNGEVVARAGWHAVLLAEGDRIEIVKPFVGG